MNSAHTSYGAIINLPRPVSQNHPPISAQDRAAQFIPFAALTGFEDAIEETARVTDDEIFLEDMQVAMIDECLRILRSHIEEHPQAEFSYFVPDGTKNGGSFKTIAGTVRKVCAEEQYIELTNGTVIPLERIIDMNLV